MIQRPSGDTAGVRTRRPFTGENELSARAEVQQNQLVLVAVRESLSVGEPRPAPDLPVWMAGEPRHLTRGQLQEPEVPHVRPIVLGPQKYEPAAIGRPRGHGGVPFAADPSNRASIGLSNVDAAKPVAIGVERHRSAIGRELHVIVLRAIVENRQHVQDAVFACFSALQCAACRSLGMEKDSGAVRSNDGEKIWLSA